MHLENLSQCGMKMSLGLKQNSKEIALKSPCICFISNSPVTPDALSHGNLKKFGGVPNDNKQKPKTKIPWKCQGCKEDEWKCKLNPCEVRLKRTCTCNTLAAYQSYKYGSNGIYNILTAAIKALFLK